MPSTRENKAIHRKEPGKRPSPIPFIPKGASIQTKKHITSQTRHGKLNPDDPRPAQFTRGTEKPENLMTSY